MAHAPKGFYLLKNKKKGKPNKENEPVSNIRAKSP